MNRIDASDHYDDASFKTQPPSLLTIIIDTNPRAWAALHSVLPLSKAIANILVFVNAHLAFGNDNQVAVLAAHTNRAVWLYPRPPPSGRDREGDVAMGGTQSSSGDPASITSANKFPQFAQIESSILASLRSLIDQTEPSHLPSTTLLSGALTMALAHINKTSIAFAPPKPSNDPANPSASAPNNAAPTLHSRIFVLSVSDSEPMQYIPTMNAVFAASHSRIPLDTLSLCGAPTFLQQASFITGGSFLSAASNPRGLLSYLMFGFLSDSSARQSLVAPTQDTVDFRAACFCHRNVVDTGFVCSICLSIFCEVPEGAECLTCGTRLALGSYGAKPAVIPKTRKKKKKTIAGSSSKVNGSASVAADGASATPTPAG